MRDAMFERPLVKDTESVGERSVRLFCRRCCGALAVDLQDAAKTLEIGGRAFGLAVGGIDIGDRRRRGSASRLEAELNLPETRATAGEILRTLIERIVLTPSTDGAMAAELYGDERREAPHLRHKSKTRRLGRGDAIVGGCGERI